ncbi:MAG: peptidoglycan-binding protein, partial [Clostridia bacterium]|nr:peptidoglycan-binding protein [Clostridia bacterium]
GIAGKKTVAALDSAISAKQAASQASAQTANVVYRNLNTGATGSDVTSLQTALKNLAYEVSVTGTYDSTTKAAVKAFQKQNGLTVDGVAGKLTQTKLYAGNAVAARASGVASNTSASSTQTATASTGGPSKSEIKLLHWFNDIKPTLKSGQTILVYDPSTGISWNLRLYSLGRHADAEPLTAQDTANMEKAFGNTNTWNQKAVYVRLPNGVWTIGSTHDMPHLSGSVKDNNFNGHLCVHFLRDMSECEKNDPKYGVANQNTIRSAWKSLTGETISY